MLGNLVPSADMQRATATSLQARIWWFRSKQGIEISPEAYAAQLASHPDAVTPEPAILARIEDVQRRMGLKSSSSFPSWQVHAPKADLGVKADDATSHAGAGVGEDADAPYPEHFRAIIEAVTTGKPVEGIKEIPNTVVRLPGISPVGKMQAPKKPWERNQPAQEEEVQAAALPKDCLDREFPPVEEAELGGQPQEAATA
jgi:hypothetical protein